MAETFYEYRASGGSTKFHRNFGEKGGAKRRPEEPQKVLEMDLFYPNFCKKFGSVSKCDTNGTNIINNPAYASSE
ncbi:MAG: hypothetical protein JSW28_03800 [Thermoplasmata archaeon]|nr:MAG: hypothetical protein JSW28_03800 [Thermoplasmata archaeon]